MSYQQSTAIFESSDIAGERGQFLPMPIRRIMLDRQAVMARVERVRIASKEDKGDFAQSLGIQPPNYSKLLKGKAFLTADQLYAIWRLYEADPRYIMEGVETGLSDELREKLRALGATG